MPAARAESFEIFATHLAQFSSMYGYWSLPERMLES